MLTKPILRLQKVSKTFELPELKQTRLKDRFFALLSNANARSSFKALQDVNLEVYAGETLGIIGGNGSGKSTLVKIMSGAYQPDAGGVVVRSGSHMLLNLGVGMSHELTVRENIRMCSSILGFYAREIDALIPKVLAFAELEAFSEKKVKYLSTGMIQRLSFSIAVNAQADIIFLDEVFAVGDERFRRRAVQVLEENWMLQRTVIMVSHSLPNIEKYCDRVLYLNQGKVCFVGSPKEAIAQYQENQSRIETCGTT